MIVGEHIRPDDISVNIAKAKHLTNHRDTPKQDDKGVVPPRRMSLDDCIEFLAEDELLEVTPISLRLRKRILNNELRMKATKAAKKLAEA